MSTPLSLAARPADPAELVIAPQASTEELFAVNEAAQAYFRTSFISEAGRGAREHVSLERKLPDWFEQAEGLGYLPPGRYNLRDHLAAQGVSLEAAAEAQLINRATGMVRRAFKTTFRRDATSNEELTQFFFDAKLAGQRKYYYDYPSIRPLPDGADEPAPAVYGDWLVLPVRVHDPADGRLRIGGFKFRSMRPTAEIGKQGRYRSPRESRLINWEQLLIGMPDEAPQMTRSDDVLLVEGYFDRAAVKCAVQTMPAAERPAVVGLDGVELRPGVMDLLTAKRVTLFLDDDKAGIDGTIKVGTQLAAAGKQVAIACIADGWDAAQGRAPKDPGELLERGGLDAIRRALDLSRTRGLATFAAAQIEAELRAMPLQGHLAQRLAHLDRLVPVLHVLPRAVLPKAVARIAEVVRLDESVVYLALAERGQRPEVEPDAPEGRREAPRAPRRAAQSA